MIDQKLVEIIVGEFSTPPRYHGYFQYYDSGMQIVFNGNITKKIVFMGRMSQDVLDSMEKNSPHKYVLGEPTYYFRSIEDTIEAGMEAWDKMLPRPPFLAIRLGGNAYAPFHIIMAPTEEIKLKLNKFNDPSSYKQMVDQEEMLKDFFLNQPFQYGPTGYIR